MKNLSIYFKHPTCILDELKWMYRSYKFKFITSIKLWLYNYEHKMYFNEYINAWRTDEMVCLTNYNPVIIVQRVLEEYFKGNIYPRHLEAQIHGIVVGTQDTSKNTVTIYLRCPGLIIGPYGAHIDDLEKMLTEKFGKKTEIKLVEMKSDINERKLDY